MGEDDDAWIFDLVGDELGSRSFVGVILDATVRSQLDVSVLIEITPTNAVGLIIFAPNRIGIFLLESPIVEKIP